MRSSLSRSRMEGPTETPGQEGGDGGEGGGTVQKRRVFFLWSSALAAAFKRRKRLRLLRHLTPSDTRKRISAFIRNRVYIF